MKKIHVLGLTLVAVFAFSAIAATSAFAEGEFLSGGAKIAEELPFEIKGSLLLEDMGATGTPDLLCEGTFDGKIAVGGKTFVIEAVLGGTSANMVDCTEDKGTCSGTENLVTAVHLPWKGEVQLMEGTPMTYLGVLLSEAGKVPGYTAICKSLLGEISDTCEAEAGGAEALLANEAGGLLAEFSEVESVTAPGKCSLGGAKMGLLQGDGMVTDPNGGALTVSE